MAIRMMCVCVCFYVVEYTPHYTFVSKSKGIIGSGYF